MIAETIISALHAIVATFLEKYSSSMTSQRTKNVKKIFSIVAGKILGSALGYEMLNTLVFGWCVIQMNSGMLVQKKQPLRTNFPMEMMCYAFVAETVCSQP
jgi:hypothetical protein